MSKYADLVAELTAKADALRAELHKTEELAAFARSLDKKKTDSSRPPIEDLPAKDALRVSSQKLVGGSRQHVGILFDELRGIKMLAPRLFFLNKAIEVEGTGKDDQLDQRVTNTLQHMRRQLEAVAYKTGLTNQSTVWGPPDAFENGKPKDGWTW